MIALRDRGFPVEYIVAPDEGHGFARPVNNMAMYRRRSRSSSPSTSDGRYQESGAAPRSSTRLKEITVDPKTVTLTKTVDPASVALPTPSQPLETAPATYNVTIALGGQSMKLESTSTVTEAGGTLDRDRNDEDAAGRGVRRRPRSTRARSRCARARSSRGRWRSTLAFDGRQGDRHDGDGRPGEADRRRPRRPALRRRPRRRSARSRRCRWRRATPPPSATSTCRSRRSRSSS